jgi:hypothetical protein
MIIIIRVYQVKTLLAWVIMHKLKHVIIKCVTRRKKTGVHMANPKEVLSKINLHEAVFLTQTGTLALTTKRDPTKSQVKPRLIRKQALSNVGPQMFPHADA